MLTPEQIDQVLDGDMLSTGREIIRKHIEEQAARMKQLVRVVDAIPPYRNWFDTCTKTNAYMWEEKAADASEELDAALDALEKWVKDSSHA